jgi:hypothetical protein
MISDIIQLYNHSLQTINDFENRYRLGYTTVKIMRNNNGKNRLQRFLPEYSLIVKLNSMCQPLTTDDNLPLTTDDNHFQSSATN